MNILLELKAVVRHYDAAPRLDARIFALKFAFTFARAWKLLIAKGIIRLLEVTSACALRALAQLAEVERAS